jgi:GNAT superfamily N-acetyltransferase
MPKQSPKNKAPSTHLSIRELKTRAEIETIYPLVKQVNPEVSKREFLADLDTMLGLGYRCAGAFVGRKLAGACGIWTGKRFWCGKYMEVDNLVVDKDQRSSGIGALLMRWAEAEAKKSGCQIVMADSYTYNHASHRFYFREGYIIKGYCFVKEC